ncbi:MAG: hypothetical protein U0Y10_15265 [Spirosomataceae bacterium]
MSRFYLFWSFCWLLGARVWAQEGRPVPIEEQLMRKSAEELLLKKAGTQGRSLLQNERYLVLDKDMGTKRLRYFIGDEIRFKSRLDHRKYRGDIAGITDSTFSFAIWSEITGKFETLSFNLHDVQKIYATRRIPFVSGMQYFAPVAGVGYFMADFINAKRWKNNWDDSSVPKVSGGFVLFGVLARFLSHPVYKINKRHRLRVLKSL